MARLIDINLKLSGSQIKKAMQSAIVKELNTIVNRVWYEINSEARDIIEETIKETSEYGSLIEDSGHSLKAEFGIEDPDSKLQTIIDTWLSGVRIILKPIRFGGNRLLGGIQIQAIDSSYKDVINLPEAHHEVTRKRNNEKNDIRWLEWLLTEGTNPLIYYFYVDDEWDPTRYESRTGLAVMKYLESAVWRVPDWVQPAVYGDNWITRAMQEAAQKVRAFIAASIGLQTPGNIGLRNVRR